MVRKAVEKQNWSIGEMKDVSQLRVYSYQFLDDLSFIHKPSDVPIFYDMKPGELDQFVDAVRRLFLAAGWEGDGDLGILWLPPFVDVGIEDTWGTYVWHVKQSNNGTSWLASSAPLSFTRLRNQNEYLPFETHVETSIIYTDALALKNNAKSHVLDLKRRLSALKSVSDPVVKEIQEELLISAQGEMVAELMEFLDDCYYGFFKKC